MDIKEYITKNFDDNIHWFEEEVNRPYHAGRISHAISTIHYLKGIHNVLRDRKSTRLNSSHIQKSRMPSSA